MFANYGSQPFNSEITNHHPEFQRAKAAAELKRIVHWVAHGLTFRRCQILWSEAEGALQHFGTPAIERAEIHWCEQPFVRIRHEGIGAIAAVQNKSQFGHD